MNCYECPYFKILQEPIRAGGGGYWDLGRAKCQKLNLVTEFTNHAKLKKMVCVDESEEKWKDKEVEKTRLFIKRERLRRKLINTRFGETICLQDYEVTILLEWIKELEGSGKHGDQIGKKADRKGKA